MWILETLYHINSKCWSKVFFLNIGFMFFGWNLAIKKPSLSVRLSIKKSPHLTKWDNHQPNFLTIK